MAASPLRLLFLSRSGPKVIGALGPGWLAGLLWPETPVGLSIYAVEKFLSDARNLLWIRRSGPLLGATYHAFTKQQGQPAVLVDVGLLLATQGEEVRRLMERLQAEAIHHAEPAALPQVWTGPPAEG